NQDQHLKEKTATLEKKLEIIEVSRRKLLGEGLETSSIDEMQQIERQLERSLSNIRSRKNQFFKEHIEKLKEKCRAENAPTPGRDEEPLADTQTSEEVETELFIGWPERRTQCKRR
ncbi:Transcription factor, K-box, partial [Dillenia turbinata]